MLIIKEKIPAGAAKVDDFGDQTGPSELARCSKARPGSEEGTISSERVSERFFACYLKFSRTAYLILLNGQKSGRR